MDDARYPEDQALLDRLRRERDTAPRLPPPNPDPPEVIAYRRRTIQENP